MCGQIAPPNESKEPSLYICKTCGAAIADDMIFTHIQWHEQNDRKEGEGWPGKPTIK